MKNLALTNLLMFVLTFLWPVTSQGTEPPWSQWACFNGTVASRNRTTQNCTSMEVIDPVTNVTSTNTTCVNITETERRTDVVSANTWSSWAPAPLPCVMTVGGTATQSRTSACQTANFECSSICRGGRVVTNTVDAPLCCANQTFSEWTSWTPASCPTSGPIQQTRQRNHLPCDQNIMCEPNCSNITQTRIIAQTSWGEWGLWNSIQVPMCVIGQRSRQRICTNTTLVYCSDDCILGATQSDNQCCVVRNIWSVWSTWSQPTTTGPCPATRTRTRNCVVDSSVTGVNVSQPSCNETCTLATTDQDEQLIVTPRCPVNGTTGTITPWSQWACFSGTVALRNRIIQNCISMEVIDPVTNMTSTNTSCVNITEIDRRTDVVSANTWSSWVPAPLPCVMTVGGTVTQSRTSACQTANFECSSVCRGGRVVTNTVDAPLCCANQSFSEWTSWTPASCPTSGSIQQTRQQNHLPCDQNIMCESNCTNIIQTRIIAQTSWGEWSQWNSMQVLMCVIGHRSRQRICTSTTPVYCEGCTPGTTQSDNQCCVVRNIWSVWSTWNQPTTTGPCPATRTRTRNCVVDSSIAGVNASQPTCDETCTLATIEQDEQQIVTPRCSGNGNPGTNTGTDTDNQDKDGFPTWAIIVISAVGVILIISGLVAIFMIGRHFNRKRKYSVGSKMNDQLLSTKPTITFTYKEGIPGTTGDEFQEGMPGTIENESYYNEAFEEKNF